MDWSWWTVLYIAFGVVALWLLGEVLLQYKARLRWRLLAFLGFLGVVTGVLVPSIALIIAGAAAFGVGQTCVTLSFLRGFSTGWALGGRPGASRRRRVANGSRDQGPALEVTGITYEEPQAPAAPDAPPAHGPLPDGAGRVRAPRPGRPPADADPSAAVHPDAYGGHPVYDPGPYAHGYGTGDPQQYAAYADPYTGAAHAYADPDPYTGEAPAYAGPDPYAGTAPAHTGPYTDPYTDPYAGTYADPHTGATPAHPGAPQYGAHDPYGQPYTAGPYAAQYAADTPPGGVWVPPQRDGTQQFPPPPQEPPPYGYDQDGLQQRY
ncbi:hypothetical protein [Streptomyces somaliensis]|uniref:hypothetical protein n=1 Tax=Streptomyces somaliensis TaxID=78355 RepID=UPI0034E94D6E|nr:hypothetical protein [Streptomyces somaliensis]